MSSAYSSNHVIVVGGGLAGLTAAHTVLERGGTVTLLDKCPFFGGNSVKATSGINGAGTAAQKQHRIEDSTALFEQDVHASFVGARTPEAAAAVPVSPLVSVLTKYSAPAVEWLSDRFSIDLSQVGLLGGHSAPRTHRGAARFPGMTITYALIEALEKVAEREPHRVRLLPRCRVTKLLLTSVAPQESNMAGIPSPATSSAPVVRGVVYETVPSSSPAPSGSAPNPQQQTLYGPVILATGGFGADFSPASLLLQHQPQLASLATTNGAHCTGDGIKMGLAIGAGTVDMARVQVHPTGLVDPKNPGAKVKFLAAEALRGTGALMLDGSGTRFVNELGRRKDVSAAMMKAKGPFWLVLNSHCAAELLWHCRHYVGRGLMQQFPSAGAMAKALKIPEVNLFDTFERFNASERAGRDVEFGRPFLKNGPWRMNDAFFVAQIIPVIHYCMGGLHVDERSRVLRTVMGGGGGGSSSKGEQPPCESAVIEGLYCCGECAGGIHGINRLGGNSLLDCVVYGRIAGEEACRQLLSHVGLRRLGALREQLSTRDQQTIATEKKTGLLSFDMTASIPQAEHTTVTAKLTSPPSRLPTVSRAEVAQHNKAGDCWIIIGDSVLDVTKFLPDHPGGQDAVLLFAGKDATAEFDMLHQREVIRKYAPSAVIGTVDDAK